MAKIENFALIIGAMKCGTTSLYDYLATHPEIAPCRRKEPNFFGARAKYARGPEAYYALWRDFEATQHRYALEASSHYTKYPRHPQAARRIAAFPGRFKLIYILREPVDRVESHLAHNIAKGRVKPDSWEATFGPTLDISRYAHQLDVLHAAIRDPEILLLDFDELRDDPQALLKRCVEFLGIDPGFAFAPRPPSNTRKEMGTPFRLDPAERRRVRTALEPDIARLRATYGFDTSAWDPLQPGAKPLAPPPAGVPDPARQDKLPAPPPIRLRRGAGTGYWRSGRT